MTGVGVIVGVFVIVGVNVGVGVFVCVGVRLGVGVWVCVGVVVGVGLLSQLETGSTVVPSSHKHGATPAGAAPQHSTSPLGPGSPELQYQVPIWQVALAQE